MDSFEKVKEIICDTLSCEESDITMEASLNADLGADSLDAVELIMAIEDAFGISIPEESAKEVNKVSDLVALIDSLK